MRWHLPNLLTVGRIGLAIVFFVLLGLFKPDSPAGPWLLNAAFVLYIVAGITDILDGWLARRMNLTSAFGRIADPFVDKLLVIGAVAMLAGANFAFAEGPTGAWERTLPTWLTGGMASGVQTWMVVTILARELIVSAVRGYSESRGIAFPATPAGKIKMFLQSVAICTVLFQIANVPHARWAVVTKLVTVWLAVVATVLSGLVYLKRTRRLLEAP
jgi:CDP-diacylglycerol--glycerol-3-phosphate 3-phosphatidyltransferase